jgi:hypothetical protein
MILKRHEEFIKEFIKENLDELKSGKELELYRANMCYQINWSTENEFRFKIYRKEFDLWGSKPGPAKSYWDYTGSTHRTYDFR